MDEKKERSLRRRAIRWILDGMRSSIILKRLGRSRAWLSKWKKHFDQVDWEGLRSKSRSPHVVAHRYDGRTRRLVIQARRRLEGCIPKICHLDLSGLGKLIEFLQVVKLGKRLYPLAGLTGHLVDEGIPAAGGQLGAQEQETL